MAATTDTSNSNPSPLSSLHLHDLADITAVFHKFDANSDGKISFSELSSVILTLTPTTSPAEITAIMSSIDADRDGFIGLEEFAGFIAAGTENVEGELKEAFDLYDINKNGLISSSELGEILARVGESVTEKECVTMIESVDEDGDGFVNFKEFKTMMSRNNSNLNTSSIS